MLSDALLDPLEESFALSAPMCSDCAFEPYCGADPVYHHATSGDFVGRKPVSAFCRRNMAIFKLLLERYEIDPYARERLPGRGPADDRARAAAPTHVDARPQPLERAVWLLVDATTLTVQRRGRACLVEPTASRRRRLRALPRRRARRRTRRRQRNSSSLPEPLDYLGAGDVISLSRRRQHGSGSSGGTTAARTASC